MLDDEARARRWSLVQGAALAGAKQPAARDWLLGNVVNGPTGDEIEPGQRRRFDFPALLHLALVDRLWRCGVEARDASEIVTRFVDLDARRIFDATDENKVTISTNRLEDLVIRARVAGDGKNYAAEAVSHGVRHRRSDKIEDDYCCVVRVGVVMRELSDAVQRAATEQSKGRA